MSIPLPNSLDILGTDVELEVQDLEDAFGEWDLTNCKITIAPQEHPDYQRVTLLHEVVHAIDDFLGLGLTHKEVYGISQSIFNVLKKNPEFSEWLTSRPRQ